MSAPTVTAVSRQLAEVLASTKYTDLPADIVEDAQRSVLDWLGSALAGAVEPPARMSQRVVASLGSSDESTVFASGRSSAAGAALANGVASHILELDDVHKGSTLHPGAAVIPAALAVAERQHADGRAFLLAVVLGYDAALRIGEAVNPSHYRFWHPTGTAGTFGAAVATASLLRATPEEMLNALGTAGTQASGLWEFNADAAMSKHLHPGKAAFNGVIAADLARAGFTGATRILEGDRGFFRATTGAYDPTRVIDRLGSHWKIAENGFKLHSCCGHTHSAIDLALEMRAERGWEGPAAAAAIESIEIASYEQGLEIVKEANPRTPFQAKFSIAYAVAVALTEGRVGLEQFSADRFDENGVRDVTITELMQRTELLGDYELTAKYPDAWPARLTIVLRDGTKMTGTMDFPRGNAELPVSTLGLQDKFRELVAPHYGRDATERALNAVRTLDSARDMASRFRVFGTLATG